MQRVPCHLLSADLGRGPCCQGPERKTVFCRPGLWEWTPSPHPGFGRGWWPVTVYWFISFPSQHGSAVLWLSYKCIVMCMILAGQKIKIVLVLWQYPGLGLDVRKRSIWDMYGEDTKLKVSGRMEPFDWFRCMPRASHPVVKWEIWYISGMLNNAVRWDFVPRVWLADW